MSYDPIEVYREAVARVPAYAEFLREAHGAVPEVADLDGFAALPTTDKHGYISRFPLEEICLDGTVRGGDVVVGVALDEERRAFFAESIRAGKVLLVLGGGAS